MCDKCEKLDEKIASFLKFQDPALDPVTRKRISDAIAELEAEKAAIQCGRGK